MGIPAPVGLTELQLHVERARWAWPGGSDDDPQPECDHDERECMDCGSRSDCDNANNHATTPAGDGPCPDGCTECQAAHECPDCEHDRNCDHRWVCQNEDCRERIYD